jgi:hypothetical protein
MFMPLDQNVRLIHNMEKFSNIWDQSWQIKKFYSGRNYEVLEVRESLLSFDAESCVFQFPIQN